jgi:hypothetical protein
MGYPFGVVGGERDYLVANTVNDVISLAAPTTILDKWQQGKTESGRYKLPYNRSLHPVA